MSLFQSKPLGLALGPGGIGIVRGARAEVLPVPGPQGWSAGLAVLGDWLAAEKPRAAQVRMLVSAQDARFCLVPWPHRHLSAEQQQAWLRLHFEKAYGDMQGWQTVLDTGGYGQASLACALPMDLVAQWHGLCRRHRLAGGRLQPYAVQVWNHWRRHVQPGQLWGVAESDRIVWSRFGGRGWSAIRCTKARASAGDLPALALQELQLQGGNEADGVVLHIPGQAGEAARPPEHGRLHWLALPHGEEPACLAMARLAAA